MQHDVGLVTGDCHDDRVGDALCLQNTGEIVPKIVGAKSADARGSAQPKPALPDALHWLPLVVASREHPSAAMGMGFPADQFFGKRLAQRYLSTLSRFRLAHDYSLVLDLDIDPFERQDLP